ncbi:MAG: hypothetical protein KDI98_06525 [Hyphomicrobiaceae bacterium]|nr:hypothetical protein [Hyphomicrobiaceae bacterium]
MIQQTRLSHLPEPIEHQRRIVEARALTDLGRAELALQLLTPLSGSDVDRLRAEAYISGNKWQEAAETLERMMGERWSDTVPLAEAERLDVLRAAIAYSLAGDGIGLDRLRRKFAAKMSDSPHARAFDVVSAPIETRGIEFREVARQIASVDTMRQFLSDYRSQYAGPPVTEEQPAAATPAS